MEPRLPTPSPETGGYRQPEVTKPVEVQPVRERQEVITGGEQHETQQPAPAAAPAAPIMPVLPTPQAAPGDTSQPSTVGDTPLAASDDDLIEREWVDKAKRIVQDTRSDPYQQEDKVSKLQADYLKKRYGKDLGSGN